MGKLAEKIAAAEKRRDDAASNQDEAAKAAAESELSTLRSLDSEGYGYTQNDVSTAASTAREEGSTSGRTKAEKDVLKRLGIGENEDSEAAIKAIADWRANQQTEADRYKNQAETLEGERDSEKAAREAAEEREKALRIQQALSEEFTKQGVMSDRRGGAFAQVNRSDLEVQDDGSVKGVEDAVKKLSESAAYLFVEEKEPSRPNGSRPTPRPKGGSKDDKERDEEARRRHEAAARANF